MLLAVQMRGWSLRLTVFTFNALLRWCSSTNAGFTTGGVRRQDSECPLGDEQILTVDIFTVAGGVVVFSQSCHIFHGFILKGDVLFWPRRWDKLRWLDSDVAWGPIKHHFLLSFGSVFLIQVSAQTWCFVNHWWISMINLCNNIAITIYRWFPFLFLLVFFLFFLSPQCVFAGGAFLFPLFPTGIFCQGILITVFSWVFWLFSFPQYQAWSLKVSLQAWSLRVSFLALIQLSAEWKSIIFRSLNHIFYCFT